MVQGLETFKDFFIGYEDAYVLIGGFAYVYWMEQSGLDARNTKDLDIVVLSRSENDRFITRFLEFIEQGAYQNRSKSQGKVQNYRFTNPKPGYPKQIELLMGRNVNIPKDQITIHHLTEAQEEISAILLDEPYYNLIEQEHLVYNGISIVDLDVLILLKMKAWINFTHDKRNGIKVKSVDLNKHRKDVLNLIEIVAGKSNLSLTQDIIDDMEIFLYELQTFNTIHLEYEESILTVLMDRIKEYFSLI